MLAGTLGVVIGTAVGTPPLDRLPPQLFRRILSMLLVVLGVYMAVWGSR